MRKLKEKCLKGIKKRRTGGCDEEYGGARLRKSAVGYIKIATESTTKRTHTGCWEKGQSSKIGRNARRPKRKSNFVQGKGTDLKGADRQRGHSLAR